MGLSYSRSCFNITILDKKNDPTEQRSIDPTIVKKSWISNFMNYDNE